MIVKFGVCDATPGRARAAAWLLSINMMKPATLSAKLQELRVNYNLISTVCRNTPTALSDCGLLSEAHSRDVLTWTDGQTE